MRRRNVFWGIALLAAAAALLLSKLGILGGISFWPMVLNIALLAILIKEGIEKRSFEGLLLPLAFLIIVNDKALGMEAITPWPVLGAAVLGSIGLKFLFPGFGRRHGHRKKEGKGQDKGAEEYTSEKGRIFYKNTFGDSTKYVSGIVSRIEVVNNFGSIQVYLTETLLADRRAEVDVKNSFGSIVIYVPAVWKVVLDVGAAFGSVDENGKCNPYGEDVVYIEGSVNFGSVEIVYVGEEQCAGSESFDEPMSEEDS